VLEGSVTGVDAAIRWHHYPAAVIRGYVVTRVGADWRLKATIASRNAYNLAQRPLVLVVPYKGGACWYWPVHEYTLHEDGAKLSARLGPPLEESVIYGSVRTA